jgi:hypothetical protein
MPAVALSWIGLIAAGSHALMRHAWSAGSEGRVATVYPSASRLALAADRPTLLFFAHPHCPCTRVSLAELAWVLDRSPSPVIVRVQLATPADAPEGWSRTLLRDQAALLPGATILDDDGREAARFGALTSGHVILFAADGRRLFSGGVTAGRGHRGGNPGRDALLAALRDGSAAVNAPVFGCPLFPESIRP